MGLAIRRRTTPECGVKHFGFCIRPKSILLIADAVWIESAEMGTNRAEPCASNVIRVPLAEQTIAKEQERNDEEGIKNNVSASKTDEQEKRRRGTAIQQSAKNATGEAQEAALKSQIYNREKTPPILTTSGLNRRPLNHPEQIRFRRWRDGFRGARKEEAEPSDGGR